MAVEPSDWIAIGRRAAPGLALAGAAGLALATARRLSRRSRAAKRA
jgi:hypothetical protein